jgi:phosphoribosyl 1,2-cyclic phosphodiesterase
MFRFAVLGSGSGGNSYWFGSTNSGILIDCGLSTKQIKSRMEELGLSLSCIDAVFVTHGHTDHVGSCKILDKALNKGRSVSFYMSKGTHAFSDDRCLPPNVRFVSCGDVVEVGDLRVEAFGVTHDAPETLAYRVEHKGLWGGVLTDLGSVTPNVLNKMRSLSIMALEFNHDPKMLFEGSYSYSVKERVASMEGHLSNKQAEDALAEVASPRLQQLIAAHISERNNTFAHVENHIDRALRRAGAVHDIQVHLAKQNQPSQIFTLTPLLA